MAALEKVLEDALTLLASERAKLASELLASIEGPRETDAALEAAWAEELDRRADEALRGAPGIDAATVHAEARANLRARRQG